MLIPISDDDRALVKPAYVTWSLVAINILVFLLQTVNPEVSYRYAAVAAEITTGQDITEAQEIKVSPDLVVPVPHGPGPTPIQLTLLTSLFLHGSWMHLLGNMLYLWIFGDNVEHRFGHFKFLLFYLASGIAGSLAQIAISPNSIIPMLGASGAISGVLGAYLVLFPRNKVFAIFLIYIVSVPALVVIGIWAAVQIYSGYQSLGGGEAGGVAYAAHVGGFAAGLVCALICKTQMKEEPDTPLRRAYHRDPKVHRIW